MGAYIKFLPGDFAAERAKRQHGHYSSNIEKNSRKLVHSQRMH